MAELRYTVIPSVLDDIQTRHPDDGGDYRLTAHSPSGSNLVIVEAKAAAEHAGVLPELVDPAVNLLLEEHSGIYQAVKDGLEAGLAEARQELGTDNASEGALRESIMRYQVRLANLRNTTQVMPGWSLSTKTAPSPWSSLRSSSSSESWLACSSCWLSILCAE